MFVNSGEELLEICKEQNLTIWEYTLRTEAKRSKQTEKEVFEEMKKAFLIMKESARKGREKSLTSVSGLVGGDAYKLEQYYQNNETLTGDLIVKAMAMASSTSEINAAMGRIVATPTAGSAGIVPAVILSVGEKLNKTDDELVQVLFTSAGLGILVAKNATTSGAEGGCQAECGAASAMAAAAVVEMMGGTVEQALDAGAMVIKNILGLVCDPVAGLVEIPCVKRNMSGAVSAIAMAEVAMAGVKSHIPWDDAVEAMDRVGKQLPSCLRETGLGGVAITKSGLKMKEKVFGNEK